MLEVEALSVARGGQRFHFDFCASSGITAVLGASGVGKTTLLHAISGLVRPESGSLRLFGRHLFDSTTGTDLSPAERRIAYCFQEPRLFPHLSVRRNLEFGLRLRGRGSGPGMGALVEQLGMEELLDRSPEGLSGGEKRRVSLGRALLSAPHALLLDEPLTGLDGGTRARVISLLRDLFEDLRIPALCVSHEITDILRLTRRVVVVAENRTVYCGDLVRGAAEVLSGKVLSSLELRNVLTASVLGQESGALSARIGESCLSLPLDRDLCGPTVVFSVRPEDVLVAVDLPGSLSARNSIKAQVVHIRKLADRSMVHMVLEDGQDLLSEVTEKAAQDLCLRESLRVWAIFKTFSAKVHKSADV